jgi:hypothetical protein
MRRLLPAILVALAAAVLAATADARPPQIVNDGPLHVEFDIPAGAVCAFPLHVEQDINTRTKTFFDRDGNPIRGLTTGSFIQYITNVRTGDTLRENISGPARFDGQGNLIWGSGRWGGIFLNGRLVSASGHIVFGQDGGVVSVRGRLQDTCGLIADLAE